MDRLRAIRAFAAVVEAESYTAAAQKLALSRSHVSKQIKELEEELGVRLLHRTTKKVRVTELGRAYYETCERLVKELDETERALALARHVPRGVLKVLAPKSFALLELVPALRQLREDYPQVEVDIYLIDQWMDLIEHGFDLAIRFGDLPDSTLVARRICCVKYVVCATPDYLRAHGAPEAPDDLKRHECLRHLKMPGDSRWRFVGPAGPTAVEVRGRLSCNSTILIREAVLQGYGIGLLPSYSVRRELAQGALVPLIPQYRALEMPLHAVYPASRHLAAKVRLFIDFLVERFASLT